MVNADILERLRLSRQPKAKKLQQPSKEKADKRKAEEAADKAAGVKKTPKPFKRNGGRSEKMRGVISALRPLYDKFLKSRPDCEIVSPVCTGEATEVHHIRGRSVNIVLDSAEWKSACSACHHFLHKNDKWARDNGFLKTRF